MKALALLGETGMSEKGKGLDLPRRLYLAVISGTRFNTSYSDLVRYAYEVEQVKRNQGLFGEALTKRLLERAQSRLETL